MNAVFELKIEGQAKPVEWDGANGKDAAQRYVAAHPGAVVKAWRSPKRERVGMFLGSAQNIVEPGEPRW